MIGSHDSFTYLSSTSFFFNIFKRLWKTQKYNIVEQYNRGVRMFDIRVRRDIGCWRVCHGICDLKLTFPTLDSICIYMMKECPDAIYRIVLERGQERIFKLETIYNSGEKITDKFPNLWRVDIKSTNNWMGNICNNNMELYKRGYKFALSNTWEEPAHELHGIVTSKNFYKINLKKEANKINKKVYNNYTSNELYGKEKLFLLDYV